MYSVKQGTAVQDLVFMLVDNTDHITPETGVTPTVTIRKQGGSFAAPAGAVTEIANGWYKVAGNATDSDTLGPLLLHATATGCDPVDMVFPVVAYNPLDIVRLGLTSLPNVIITDPAGLPIKSDFVPLNAQGQENYQIFFQNAGAKTATTVDMTANPLNYNVNVVTWAGKAAQVDSNEYPKVSAEAMYGDVTAAKNMAFFAQALQNTGKRLPVGAIDSSVYNLAAEAAGVPTGHLERQRQLWTNTFSKSTIDLTTGKIAHYLSNGSTISVQQTISSTPTSQTVGVAA